MPTYLRLSLVALTCAVATTAVVVSLIVTNPAQVGPVGVTLWFVGLLVALSGLLTIGLFVLKVILWPQQSRPKQLLAARRQGMLLAALGTILLALQSLRQLSGRDILLISVLILLIEFYWRTKS